MKRILVYSSLILTLLLVFCACSAPQTPESTSPEPAATTVASPESTDDAQGEALAPTANLAPRGEAFRDMSLDAIKAIFEGEEVADHTYTLLFNDPAATLISAESGICIIRHGENGDEFGYFDKVTRSVYDPLCTMSEDGKYLALSCTDGAYLIDIDGNTLHEIFMTDSTPVADSLYKSILLPYPIVLGWDADDLLIDYPFESSAEHTADDPAHCCFSIAAKTGEVTALSEEPKLSAPDYDAKAAEEVISKYFKLYD